MLDVFLIIIIILSGAGIVFLIVRRFPEISAINIETLNVQKTEKERAEKIKEEMIIKRLKDARINAVKFIASGLRPLAKKTVAYFQSLIKKFKETEKRYKEFVKNIPKEDIPLRIKELMNEAENFMKNLQYDLAEKYYLEALSLDFKNVGVYENLAWLYMDKKQYKEAREALEFILKLNPNYQDAYYGLAELSKREERIDEAVEFAKKAVELSSSNPKYLDFLIEMCIIGKRADLAGSALEQLRLVNPENQKIDDFLMRIQEIKKG